MKSQRIHMTIDEYLQMQQPFGYKVEYINGEAIFEPKYGWYRREIHRLKALGVIGNLAALQQECDCWYKLLEDDWKSGL